MTGPYHFLDGCAAIIRHSLPAASGRRRQRAAAGELSLATMTERSPGGRSSPDREPELGRAGSLYRRIRRRFDDLRRRSAGFLLAGAMTARGLAGSSRGGILAGWSPATQSAFRRRTRRSGRRDLRTEEGATVWRALRAGKPLGIQSAGRGRAEHLLLERFGPLTFGMAVVVADGRLELILRRWSFLGLTLPLWLGPRSLAYESGEDDRFRFHVEIALPLVGLIVRYRGWLVPD
jgi:hypothetical protein